MNDILNIAKTRQTEADGAYDGSVTPTEAHQLCQDKLAVLVDVRTVAELQFVGRTPFGVHIEWQAFPTMAINSFFAEELQKQVAKDKPLLFLCRSGVRSHSAAMLAKELGYESYNVLEGFEGQIDEEGHRNTVSGWRFHQLPWLQS